MSDLTREDIDELLDEVKKNRTAFDYPRHDGSKIQSALSAISIGLVVLGSVILASQRIAVLENKVTYLTDQVTALTTQVQSLTQTIYSKGVK
jgi:hypothetical protein